MNLKQLIEEYLKEAKVMQIATVKDDQPWVCTVNYAYDQDWNLYWMSLRTRRHSQELVSRSKVAGAIVKNPEIKQGLQFEGVALEVPKDDLPKAHELYAKRYGDKPERLAEAQSENLSLRTYYTVKLTHVVLYDEVNFPENPRQEYDLLSQLKK